MDALRWLRRKRWNIDEKITQNTDQTGNVYDCPLLTTGISSKRPDGLSPRLSSSMNTLQNGPRAVVRKISERDETTGRFEIITEQIKEPTTVAEESDNETDVSETADTPNSEPPHQVSSTTTMTAMTGSASNGTIPHVKSRFNLTVVPVDAKFVRGRWHCYDYVEKPSKTPADARSDMIEIDAHRGRGSGASSNASSFNADHGLHMLKDQQQQQQRTDHHNQHHHTPALINVPDPPTPITSVPSPVASTSSVAVVSQQTDQETQPALPNAKSVPHIYSSIAHTLTPIHVSTPVSTSSPFSVLGSLSQSVLQQGASYNSSWLENLLPAPGTTAPAVSPQGTGEMWNYDNPSASSGHHNPIDSKIEQAMDLVKTHLTYAVREEVEVLRAKIIELEKTVLLLESENAVLREHIPADVLSRINVPTSGPPSVTTSQSSSQVTTPLNSPNNSRCQTPTTGTRDVSTELDHK